jgi:SAM-dependent methyltransferase
MVAIFEWAPNNHHELSSSASSRRNGASSPAEVPKVRTHIRRRLIMAAALATLTLATLAVSPFGREIVFHLSPVAWTGEPARLAAMLRLEAGMAVADIGAGDGAMALEMARVVGPTGRLFVTERTTDKRLRLTQRLGHLANIAIVEALEDRTNLPDACCDAIYLRMVWHHLSQRPDYGRSLARALRPGGRLVVIDFPPSAFFHLEPDHGVHADRVVTDLAAAGFSAESRDDHWGRAFAVSFVRESVGVSGQR